jgi:hypothetical protein
MAGNITHARNNNNRRMKGENCLKQSTNLKEDGIYVTRCADQFQKFGGLAG